MTGNSRPFMSVFLLCFSGGFPESKPPIFAFSRSKKHEQQGCKSFNLSILDAREEGSCWRVTSRDVTVTNSNASSKYIWPPNYFLSARHETWLKPPQIWSKFTSSGQEINSSRPSTSLGFLPSAASPPSPRVIPPKQRYFHLHDPRVDRLGDQCR